MEVRNTSIEAFREKTKDHLSRIEDALREELDRYSWSRLYGPMVYALQGGKRIRPLIVLLSVDAVGNDEEDPLMAAVAVELLHTESIIHDDIIDEEALRREKASFHVKYGYNASVLSADFVFGMILDIASRYKSPRIARELSSAALRMCEGEFRELRIDPDLYRLSWDEYISLISYKTASLFETAAKVGGIIGGGSEDEIRALSNYGLQLGIAYQIQDDALDWGQKDKITRALTLNPQGTDPLSHLRKMPKRHAEKAKNELQILKETPAGELLKELADFAVSRSYMENSQS